MRRRAGAVLLVAVLATACGNGSSGGASGARGDNDVLSVIQAAAKSTAEQRSMQVRGTVTMDLSSVSGGASGATSMTLAGTMQTSPTLGRLTMSGLSVAGQSLGDVTVLMTKDAMYMKMAMLAQQTGKPWAVLKFSEMKAMSGFDMSELLSQSQQVQPAQYVEQLTASGDVRVVGTETVNGVETTHYSGTVSLEEALSHYSDKLRAQMRPLMEKAGFTGSDLDIWLDDEGLVRRVKSEAEGGTGSFSFAMDVLAYGVKVDVTPPPADQVVDLAQLSSGGGFG